MEEKKKCDIYCESYDSANIYIEINDLTDCCFEIWDVDGDTKSRAKIRIPLEEWKQMLKKWAVSKIKKEDNYEYL